MTVNRFCKPESNCHILAGDPLILEKVQEQLAQKEAKEQKLTAEWIEKWREAAKILQVRKSIYLIFIRIKVMN